MFSLIRKGGVVMIPLGLASVLALAFAIERFISLRRDKIIPPDFMKRIVELVETDPSGDAAIKFCAQTERPAAHIMKAGLLGLLKSGDAAEKAIEDAGAREASKMKRSLRILSVIATVSPLLGLLGTVYGMISAFQTASAVGMGKADVLAKGIYEALVTTAAGLTIAIPVLLAYQYLSSRVDSIVDDLDEIGIEFMTSCSKNT
jgi:biopolymer transport protein ExbB